jgi:hypothetical protein
MAAKYITGVDGSVTLPSGFNLKSDSWSLTVSQALVNVTNYASGGYEENVGGLKRGSFSITGVLKYDDTTTTPGLTAIAKLGSAFTLLAVTGCTYAFTGIITSAPISSDVNAGLRAAYSGVTSGTITEVWDETA